VGPFLNPVPLVFSYDENKTFLEWLEIVRNHVFEVTTRGELPYDHIREHLRASGDEVPDMLFYFAMSRDNSDQHFGNLTIRDEFWSVGTMPSGCTVFLDERNPENCRVNFDANTYDQKQMRAMLDRYLGLLLAAAQEPEAPMWKLLMNMRWDAAMAEIIAGEPG
jgi:hypothetical protein